MELLCSMGLLELATEKKQKKRHFSHGKTRKKTEAKNFYRKDAKYAKKEKQCLMLLSALSVFAVKMV